jgi:hypothetical protein
LIQEEDKKWRKISTLLGDVEEGRGQWFDYAHQLGRGKNPWGK